MNKTDSMIKQVEQRIHGDVIITASLDVYKAEYKHVSMRLLDLYISKQLEDINNECIVIMYPLKDYDTATILDLDDIEDVSDVLNFIEDDYIKDV